MCGSLLSWTPIIQIAWEILHLCLDRGEEATHIVCIPHSFIGSGFIGSGAEEANNPLLRLIAIAPTSLWLIKPTSFFCTTIQSRVWDVGAGMNIRGAGQVFGQKEWLLTLENLQTFGQRDVWTKTQKHKQTNREFNIRMSGQFRILATFFICIMLRFGPKTVIAYN